ncbi:MAG: hypothetical protein K0S43_1673 [Cellulosimicrobium sp.]|nr:hypothetical protein [Cellulosimicrobium sp.]
MSWVSWMLGNPLPFPVALAVDVALLAAAVVAALLWWDGRRAVVPSSAGRRAVRHAAGTSAGAGMLVAAGILLPPLYLFLGLVPLGVRTTAVLPLVALVGALAVHAVGELTWPRPTHRQREARLDARSTADVVPALTRRLAWVWAGGIVVASVAFGLLSDGPRSISRVIGRYEAYTVAPFPGWLWTVPLLVATVVAVVASEVVLRLVASRPAVEDVDVEWDMWLRRRVARRVARATQLVLGLTLGGLVALGGLSLRWLGLGSGDGLRTGPGLSPAHVQAGNVLLLVALAVGAVAIAVLVWPARDPAPTAAPAREPAGAVA